MCPNSSKSSGGIDIHREWSSLLGLQRISERYKTLKLNPPIEKEEKAEEEKKSPGKAQEVDWKKAIIDKMSKESDHKDTNEAQCDIPEFQSEFNRHRCIIALIISRIYAYILGHLKNNCKLPLTIIGYLQYLYFSQLMVDANGVLVILKFLNQDLSKIKLPGEPAFFKEAPNGGSKLLLENIVKHMLKLLHCLCSKYPERIKAPLYS